MYDNSRMLAKSKGFHCLLRENVVIRIPMKFNNNYTNFDSKIRHTRRKDTRWYTNFIQIIGSLIILKIPKLTRTLSLTYNANVSYRKFTLMCVIVYTSSSKYLTSRKTSENENDQQFPKSAALVRPT